MKRQLNNEKITCIVFRSWLAATCSGDVGLTAADNYFCLVEFIIPINHSGAKVCNGSFGFGCLCCLR